MKHLKRSLSLVLALVMVVGMFTISANAAVDFPDADEVTYTEAVDVLVGLGVFEGSDNGQLNPQGNITREQAAKLIAYALLGKTAADALSVSAAPFDDVAASRWSAGYIAYCVNQGIINGVGDNKFNPQGNLTGIQFAKMLLCAAGYGVNDEFVGSGWDIEVSTYALRLGVFAGNLGANQAAAINRETAALYLFNTLTGVPTVRYSDVFGDYYTGNSVLSQPSGEFDQTSTSAQNPYTYTLGYTNFGLLKKTSGSETDDFGRPYYSWTSYSNEISDDYAGSTADYTYTGFVSAATLYNDLGSALFNQLASASYVVDGASKSASDLKYDALNRLNPASGIGGAGATVEVYITEGTTATPASIEKIVIINNYFGVVTGVRTVAGVTTANISAYVTSSTPTTLTFASTAYEQGDVLVLNLSYKSDTGVALTPKVVSAEPATLATTGTVSAYNYLFGTLAYIRVNGTNYTPAGMYELQAAGYDDTYNIYLDNQGNLIGVTVYEEGVVTYNYLYVSDSAITAFSPLTGSASVRAVATFANGETAVIDIAVSNANSANASFNVGEILFDQEDADIEIGEIDNISTAKINAGFYSYRETNGVYTLRKVTAETIETGYVEPTGATVSIGDPAKTYYLSSSTQLVLMNSGVTYTGYRNFPADIDADTAAVFYEITTGNMVKAIYVYGTADVQGATNYVYYVMAGDRTADGNYHYFYDNSGAMVAYLFDEGDDADLTSVNSIYTITVDANGYADATAVAASEIKGGYDSNSYDPEAEPNALYVSYVDDEYFMVTDDEENSDIYYFSDNCAIYDATLSGAGEQVDTLRLGDQVRFVTSESEAAVVYIIG